jgi:NADPH2:quinone reductase
MSLIIRQHAYGDAQTLVAEQHEVGEPGPGEVRLRQHAIGVNFIDFAFRSGAIRAGELPVTIGVEAAGEIEALGSGVSGLSVGDRVSYTSVPRANAERRIAPASAMLRIPDGLSYEQAAAITAKGLTAGALLTRARAVGAGDIVLVHAAAGGVGSLLVRWAKALDAVVIATVGSEGKRAAALQSGADHVVVLDSNERAAAEITAFTAEAGVDVVFDGVGRATAEVSAWAVAPGGTIVLFGTSSGEPTIDREALQAKRVTLLRPSLDSLAPTPADRQELASALFALVASGRLGELPVTTYPLADIAQAHRDLESRRSTGSLVLTV